jgi:hypothetical protein
VLETGAALKNVIFDMKGNLNAFKTLDALNASSALSKACAKSILRDWNAFLSSKGSKVSSAPQGTIPP